MNDDSLDAGDFIFVDDNNNAGLDSCFSVFISPGNYLLVIGAYDMKLSEVLSNTFLTPRRAGDHKLSHPNIIPFDVPEPSLLILLAVSLIRLHRGN